MKEELDKVKKEINEFNSDTYILQNSLKIYDSIEPNILKYKTMLYIGESASVKDIHERTGKALELVKGYNRGKAYVDDRGYPSGMIFINYYETDEELLVRLTNALERQKRALKRRKDHVIVQYNRDKEYFDL